MFGADHELKTGAQFERGQHRNPTVIPNGVRFVDSNGQPSQAIASAPANAGGLFNASSAFVSDAITIGDRLTVNAGLRFDHSRAVSQDLHAVDLEGRATDEIVPGLGALYTWNVLSPRLGFTARVTSDGRTILRGSYGRFQPGVLTGELAPFHPGATAITTTTFDRSTGLYGNPLTVDPNSNLQLDPNLRPARTDEYSLGLDRELGHQLSAAVAYVHKQGADFVGWTDVGGRYAEETRTLEDGRIVPVFVLVGSPGERRFLLTNPDGYSLDYNGLVMVVEKRRSHGWQAFASYTLSRATGLQASSGTSAAGGQVSTTAPPPAAGVTFGRDPNDLTNAVGRLPNDRPQMLKMMGSLDVPKTGFVVAANFGFFSGKPWASSAQIALPQNSQQRVLLEPRGSQRLPSQSLLDLRISRGLPLGGTGRIDLVLDVLNALNEDAPEGIVTDNWSSANFGRGNVFVDPRRVMISAKVRLGH